MRLLLKCLVICSKALNYFLISTYVPNQKLNSAPPILFIRRHRVSNVIATTTNPRQIGLTDRDLGLTDGIANSLLPIAILSVSPKLAIAPTEIAM